MGSVCLAGLALCVTAGVLCFTFTAQSFPLLFPPTLPRLQTGWSVHTFQTEKQRKMQALSPQELEVILEVIRKAEKLDIIEQQRIGYSHVHLSPSLRRKGQLRQRSGSSGCLRSASISQSIP